jgi:hypothetical protein
MLAPAAVLFETPEEIFLRVFRELRPRTKPPDVKVEFRAFANANSAIRWEHDSITIRITDILEGAPAPILEALAYILVSKLVKKPVPKMYAERYRRFLNRKEMRRSLQLLRQARGRKFVSGGQGLHYNLDEMFEELNFRYFHARSRTLLGHFDPSHNAIILSKLLDDVSVPKLAVEYVLFHEMLHLQFPVEHRGARRCVHTPEFKKAEKRFERWKDAKDVLKVL